MVRFAREQIGFLGICLLIFALDQFAKWLVSSHMALYQSIPIIPGFFNLTYIHNRGVIFGLFSDSDSPWVENLILVLSLISFVVIALYFLFLRHESRWTRLGFSFVLGGALGNTWDRLVQGYVIDFLDVYYGPYHWPTFNLADLFITLGIVMLVLHMLGAQWRADADAHVEGS